MCAPKIMDIVNKRLSRRNLLKASLVGGAGIAATSLSRVRAHEVLLDITNIVDLTHTMHEQFPMFPGAQPPKFSPTVTVADDGFYGQMWEIWEHTGTHLDAPAHFIEGGQTADQLSLENFVAPIAVIDISAKAQTDDDATLDVADIESWEAEHGELPVGVAVMMFSGWAARVDAPTSYINADADGVAHFPGFSKEAADFLISKRNVVGIGVDTLSLDSGASTTFDAHVSILGAGRYGLENVANLNSIPQSGAYLIVGQPKVKDASGGPVGLMAVFG